MPNLTLECIGLFKILHGSINLRGDLVYAFHFKFYDFKLSPCSECCMLSSG